MFTGREIAVFMETVRLDLGLWEGFGKQRGEKNVLRRETEAGML